MRTQVVRIVDPILSLNLQAYHSIPDCQAFRHKGKLRISKQQVADTAGLPRTLQFTVRDGKLHTEGDSWWVKKFLRMAEG